MQQLQFYFGQILGLLFVVPVATQLVDAQVRMGSVGQPDSARRPTYFLHNETVLEIPQAQASVAC